MAYRDISSRLIPLLFVIIAGGCNIEQKYLFPGTEIVVHPEIPIPKNVEQWWIESPQGRVEAWFIRGDGASADQPAPTVVFAHGNGELIDHWPAQLQPYVDRGMNVLIPEFRGYGRSAGKPGQKQITSDFVAFYDLLVTQPEVDTSAIIFHGRSLGGGVVVDLARKRPPAACILQSAFASVPAVVSQHGLPGSLVTNRYDNRSGIEQLDCPVLLIHGRDDRVVPIDHAHTLHAAARDARLVILDCGHNDMPMDDRYWKKVFQYIDRALQTAHLPRSAAALQ